MYNPIEEKRRFVQSQIQKSFDSGIDVTEEIELEKAHKDGDHHPTKPWVWVSSANGGKGDWRVEGGRAHKKAGAGTTDAAAGGKVDISKIPDAEFKRITQMLEKKNPDHRDAERYLEEEAMSDKELKNFHAVAEHFKNSSKINKMTQEYCRKWAELAKQEMQYRRNQNSSSTTANSSKYTPMLVKTTNKNGTSERLDFGEPVQFVDNKGNKVWTIRFENNHTSGLFDSKESAQSAINNAKKKVEDNNTKSTNNSSSLSFSDFKLLPLGTVVSGGGYELKKDGKNRWVSLSNGKSNGATKNDDDAFRLQEFDDFKLDKKQNNTPAPRKPGSTDEIERMTAQGVRSSILGLNNIATNVKDNGDHFKIDFDANDFNTNGKRSPQIDRIAKFLESMGASCVIGKNGIKAYKKVEAKKNTTSKTQSPQDKVKNIMQQFDDTTMDEDEFDEYVDSVLGNDMGQKLRKQILESNKSFSDKKQAYKDAVERHLGLKPQKYSDMDIKDAKKALVGKVVTLKDYWPDGRGGSQDAVGEIKNVRLYGKDKLPIAQISYPNGDEQLIRLDEIDDGKMKDSYKTPISVGDDKTQLDAVKKKIANSNSDPRDKIAQDAGFKDYEEMKGYQDYVTQKNLLKKRSTSAGMRLLYQQEVAKYEKDHANLIKRISSNNKK